ncbi:MAG: hypothetical protein GC179_26525 [Anaerolineaceae bacterium]|nr:hypothetical protein [Anaerolineaceae bacterium]
MDSSFLLVALILVGLVGYMAYAKFRRDQRTFDSLYKPTDGDLFTDEGDLETSGSISFTGKSDFITQRFRMRAGKYKLIYRFPTDINVKVELSSADESDHEIIGIKCGEGEIGFTVRHDDDYFAEIEPEIDCDWEIEIIRLGLPSSSG